MFNRNNVRPNGCLTERIFDLKDGRPKNICLCQTSFRSNVFFFCSNKTFVQSNARSIVHRSKVFQSTISMPHVTRSTRFSRYMLYFIPAYTFNPNDQTIRVFTQTTLSPRFCHSNFFEIRQFFHNHPYIHHIHSITKSLYPCKNTARQIHTSRNPTNEQTHCAGPGGHKTRGIRRELRKMKIAREHSSITVASNPFSLGFFSHYYEAARESRN